MMQPLGFHRMTTLTAAKGLADVEGGIPAGARFALIQSEGKAVRWRDDGTDPTAALGMSLAVGTTLEYDGPLSKIRFIETSASATLNISFFKS